MASTSSDDLDSVLSQPATSTPADDLSSVIASAGGKSVPSSVLGSINKYAGLINRGLMTGAASMPELVGDPLVAGYNALAPKVGLPQSPTNVTELVNAAENKLGMPQPQNLGEGLITGAASGLGAMAIPVPFLSKLQPATSQRLLNNTWSKAMGEDANSITPDVLQSVSNRTGAVFDSVRDSTPRVIDTAKVNSVLTGLDNDFQGLIGDGTANVTDHPLVQKLIGFATDPSGTATGEQLGKLSSQLGKAATKQFMTPGGDPDLGFALSKVKDATDDIVQQGLSPEDAAAYSTAKSQYRTMMNLLRSRALNVDTGDIKASTMGSFLQRTDSSGYAMGNNTAEHYEVTRVMREQQPNPSGLLSNFKPAGVPVGPAIQGAYRKGLLPPAIKGIAGAYEGLKESPAQQ